MIEPNYKEALRYLGYHNIEPNPEVDKQLHECMNDLLKTISPKYTYQRFSIDHMENDTIDIASMHIQSKNLSKNLQGCHAVYCLAATLGLSVDRFIERATIQNMSKAAMYQACGAALIETYVDTINQMIKEEAKQNDEFIRPRFSCGYGDFALEHQTDFSRLLNMPKTVGITLTDTLLMMPSKSVTAIIGVSKQDASCILQGCEACDKKDCEFRRES